MGPVLNLIKSIVVMGLIIALGGTALGSIYWNQMRQMPQQNIDTPIGPGGETMREIYPKIWEMNPRIDGMPIGTVGKSDKCLQHFKIEPKRLLKNASQNARKRYQRARDRWVKKKDRLCYKNARR